MEDIDEAVEFQRPVAHLGDLTRNSARHIQNVNAYTSGFKGWMARFKSVATLSRLALKIEHDGEGFTRVSAPLLLQWYE